MPTQPIMEDTEPNMERDAQAELAALSRHLIARGESEKAALARRLHDELGACLTVVSLDISVVAEKLKDSEPELAARLQRALARVKEAVAVKRGIVEELRPGMLDTLGLSVCLAEHALEFRRRTGLEVETDIAEDVVGSGHDAAIGIFRIAQEALVNAERHARASRIRLSLQSKDGGACLLVEDDGAGIAPLAMQAKDGHGLALMREHAALHGGSLRVRRREEGGTAVEAWFPLSL
jgi:signal transduction histidine kinase